MRLRWTQNAIVDKGQSTKTDMVIMRSHIHQYRYRLGIQLGQLSVIPPGLVLEAGGDFNLAGSYACKVEVPPHFKVPSGGDFSSPGMAAC